MKNPHLLDEGQHRSPDLLALITAAVAAFADNAAMRTPEVEPTIAIAHACVSTRDAVRARCSMSHRHPDSGAGLLRQWSSLLGHMADDIDQQPLS